MIFPNDAASPSDMSVRADQYEVAAIDITGIFIVYVDHA